MYILRRLLPFGVFSIGLELLYKTGLMAFEADKPDFAAAELLKTFGVMLLTTAIATLYMLIPYMLFLLALPAARLSGGQKRRAALLRALLCRDAKTLLLDEPFTGMDAELVEDAVAATKRLAGCS